MYSLCASFQCKCCAIENSHQLLPTMPDNSIAYGLLLESGQQVNIYDWMGAFNTIVGHHCSEFDEDDENISQQVQLVLRIILIFSLIRN